jgi:hypothetical protein
MRAPVRDARTISDRAQELGEGVARERSSLAREQRFVGLTLAMEGAQRTQVLAASGWRVFLPFLSLVTAMSARFQSIADQRQANQFGDA